MAENKKSRFILSAGFDFLARNLKFLLFLSVLAIYYINNVHQTTSTIRSINATKSDITNTKNTYLSLKCDLIKASKQSIISKELNSKGYVSGNNLPQKVLVRD